MAALGAFTVWVFVLTKPCVKSGSLRLSVGRLSLRASSDGEGRSFLLVSFVSFALTILRDSATYAAARSSVLCDRSSIPDDSFDVAGFSVAGFSVAGFGVVADVLSGCAAGVVGFSAGADVPGDCAAGVVGFGAGIVGSDTVAVDFISTVSEIDSECASEIDSDCASEVDSDCTSVVCSNTFTLSAFSVISFDSSAESGADTLSSVDFIAGVATAGFGVATAGFGAVVSGFGVTTEGFGAVAAGFAVATAGFGVVGSGAAAVGFGVTTAGFGVVAAGFGVVAVTGGVDAVADTLACGCLLYPDDDLIDPPRSRNTVIISLKTSDWLDSSWAAAAVSSDVEEFR